MPAQEQPEVRIIDIITVRRLRKALQDLWTKKIVPLVQSSIVPEQKEILNVTLVSDIADVTSPVEDEYYLVPPLVGSENPDAEKGQLYQYRDNLFFREDGNKGIIYLGTENDTPQMFVFDGTKYIKCQNGEVVDNTIVISDLSELDGVTDTGIYSVNYIRGTISTVQESYTLAVSRTQMNPVRYTVTQMLSNASGYKTRSKMHPSAWSAWQEFIYASKAEVNSAIESLKPLIYAGL